MSRLSHGPSAPCLTPRAVLDKLAAIQMLGVHFPATNQRTLILRRDTQPTVAQRMLAKQPKLTLPFQPHPPSRPRQ
jgi:hypothetical protein